MLDLEDVTLTFGGISALDGVSFSVPQGQICALIGPNGAGKTSLFNVLTGLYRATGGRAWFDGHDLLGAASEDVVAWGIARTFQNVALFRGMTSLDNVRVGAHSRTSRGWLSGALTLPNSRREERRLTARCLEILHRLGIPDAAFRHPDELPFGTLKRVELARALAAEPRLLLLDEPGTGLSSDEVDELVTLLRSLRDDGLTLIVVEHHMRLVMDVSDRVVALNFGQVLADGEPGDVARDPRVVEAYLGKAIGA